MLGKSERDRGQGKEKASAENQGNDDTHAATEEGGGGKSRRDSSLVRQSSPE